MQLSPSPSLAPPSRFSRRFVCCYPRPDRNKSRREPTTTPLLLGQVDIFINFFLPVRGKENRLIRTHRGIALHYARSSLAIDVISIIPVDLLEWTGAPQLPPHLPPHCCLICRLIAASFAASFTFP